MENICSRCGNTLAEGSTACPNCTGVQSSMPSNPATDHPVTQKTFTEHVKSIRFDARDEDDATVTFGDKQFKVALMLKGFAITLTILFFLPLFKVSCEGVRVTFNGLNAAFGKTVSELGSDAKIDGNFMAIFLLLIPVALFAVFQFKKKVEFVNGKLFLISSGLSALGLFGFILLAIKVNDKAGILPVSYTFWYYLSILLYIVAGIISIGCVLSTKKASD